MATYPRFFHWPSLHLDVLAGIYAASAFIQRLTDSAAGGGPLRFPQYAPLGRARVAVAGTLTIPALCCPECSSR
jgi:hypothetical protein